MIDYAKLSDAQLLALTKEGDRTAEEEMLGRYGKTVEVCTRPFFLAGGDKKDLVQEGMLGLVSAIEHYSPEVGSSFPAYAKVCIRKRLLSAIKAASRLKHLPLNESISFEQLSEDPNASYSAIPEAFWKNPEELVLAKESKEELVGALSRSLSSFESSVFDCYLEGMSYREIALHLGKSEKSIDNAVQRIRRKLATDPIFGEISFG